MPRNHDTHDALVAEWKANAEREDDANFRFLRSLKMAEPDEVDARAREVHEEIFGVIDCTRCANCCKTIAPGFNDQDIERIAARLAMPPAEFIASYLKRTELEGKLIMKFVPCPFLGKDDRCTIYDIRPDCCRTYPNTDQREFADRTHQHSRNTLTCPAAYHIVRELRRRRRRRRRR